MCIQIRLQDNRRGDAVEMPAPFLARDVHRDGGLTGDLRAVGFVPELDGQIGLLAQSFGKAINGKPASVGAAAQSFLAEGCKISAATYDDAREILIGLRPDWGDIDLLAVPTSPGLAPRLADEATEVNGRWVSWGGSGGAFRRWANALGLPAIALPVATSGPIPASLQLAAAPGQDGKLLHLCRRLWTAAQENQSPVA